MFGIFNSKNNSDDQNQQLSNTSTISDDLNVNVADFNLYVGKSIDIQIRSLTLNLPKELKSSLIYIDGLVDKQVVNGSIINELMTNLLLKCNGSNIMQDIKEKVITNAKVESSDNWIKILDSLFSGCTILFVDGYKKALIIETRGWIDRGIQEPTTEQVIRGPKDSFNETILTNTMLIRRRIKSQKLKMDSMTLGTLSKTDVVISYIDGVINPKIVEEVKKRLGRIDIDAVLGIITIEELIEDSPWALFPQINHTERPDKACSHLLEGGVVILCDNSPMVLMLPCVYGQFLSSPQDYYERVYSSMLIRILRRICLFIAILLPAFYIAVTSFHPEMIPPSLLQIIITGRRNVPFPILIEVLILEFILEVTREAGVRLPKNAGQAISIVGGLVLGQAAIQAKLASPTTVTVVALTALCNFTIPSFSVALSIRVVRFIIMIVSGIYGIFGFIIVFFLILVHLVSLRSFGVPFLAPIAPLIISDLKDTLIRFPVWLMNKRPNFMRTLDNIRQKDNLKPDPKQK